MREKPITFPLEKHFLTDLILQRTGAFIKLGGASALNNCFASGDRDGLEKFLLKNDLVDIYLRLVRQEIENELKEINEAFSQKSLDRLVSIGPGNGLVELMLVSE